MDAIAFLSLTPIQAQTVGFYAIVIIVMLDLIASSDLVPLNTPRDWILWLTQWKSLGLWNPSAREKVKRFGRTSSRYNPFNYLPVTGAFIPFMLAVLIGHFFHPGLDPFIGPGGFAGMGITVAIGVVVAVMTYFDCLGQGRIIIFAISAAGLVCGALVWPVSG